MNNLDAPDTQTFREKLEHLINCHSKENGSNTPDFILAEYLDDSLAAFDKAVKRRSDWYAPPEPQCEAPTTPPVVAGATS